LYEIAAQNLLAAGITDVDRAYAFYFNLPPRTVRRIFERCQCLMGNVLTSGSKEKTYPLGTTEMTDLTAAAKEAGIPAKVALSAVLRFGNPVERVREVLRDIRALIVYQCAPRNAPGLFVSLMRSGEGVVLPERVVLARQVVKPESAVQSGTSNLRAAKEQAAAAAQMLLDASAQASPAEQWAQRGAGLRLLLRGLLSAPELLQLEQACQQGRLLTADLARSAAAAKAGGGLNGWARELKATL